MTMFEAIQHLMTRLRNRGGQNPRDGRPRRVAVGIVSQRQDLVPTATRRGRLSCESALFTIAFFTILSPVLALAAEVELRLVPFDQPDSTVDKLEKSRPLMNPVSTPQGMVMEKVGVETVSWGRNIFLDGKSIFERYHEGRYIDRLPIARPDLKPGDHIIWPGNHTFTVAADGTVSTKSPELIVDGKVVKIRCYPVTVRAFVANPDEADMPLSMRVSALPNLTIRESGDVEAKEPKVDPKADPKAAPVAPGKPLDLLPVFDKFSPLTLWLPANTIGKGYLIHPVGLTFHLSAEGVKPAAGGGTTINDLRIEKNLIDIPLYGFPVNALAAARVIVPGVEQYAFKAAGGNATKWYPRAQPYVLQMGELGPTIAVDGDLRKFPFKSIAVDSSDRAVGAQRLVVVESEARHLSSGKPLHVRVRAMDTKPVQTASNHFNAATKEAEKFAAQLAPLAKKKADAEAAIKASEAQLKAKSDAIAKPDVAEAAKKTLQTEIDALKAKQPELAAALAAATPEVETLSAKVEQLRASAAELKTKLDAAQDVNPIEGAEVFAQARAFEGGEWKTLAVKPAGGAREFDIAIPELTDGIYELKVGINSEDPSQGPLSTDAWVTIAGERAYSIGLFTERARDSFYRGEGFWIGLGVVAPKSPVPAGTQVSVELVDKENRRIPIYQQATAVAIEKRDTIIVRLTPEACLLLAAGRYRAEAKVGAASSRPFEFDLVEPEPTTRFTNLLNIKYNAAQREYNAVLASGERADEFASWVSGLGYNAVMGMSYSMHRVNRRNAVIEQLVRERAELGPWESYYRASGRDRLMSAFLRKNIRFYEDMFTYNDTMLPREPHILDACERFVALETASMRHNPAFKGVSLYDEFYNTGDSGSATAVVAAHYAAQEMAYRKQYEKEGYTSVRSLKAFDRWIGRPAGQRDFKDLAMFRTWAAREDEDWRDFSVRMSSSVKRVMPDSFNFTLTRYHGDNGGNIGVHGVARDVFTGLDAAVCVMYKDGGSGDRPVFAPMQANVMRVRDDLPVWTQLHDWYAPGIYSNHILRQAFFALGEKIDGFSAFTLNVDVRNSAQFDHRPLFRNLFTGVTEPYGDFFMSLDRGYNQVGIYYSRQADFLKQRKPNSLPTTVEGLWTSCMRAGFPAQFIDDEQLLTGQADKYKVIFVPGIVFEDETAPNILKALQKLADAGKTIIVEKSSKLPIERIVRADSEFDEYDDKLGGAFPRYTDWETQAVINGSEETSKLLRQMLPKYVQPATETNMLFSPNWLKKGQGQFMVMTNFAPAKFTGLYRTLYQAPDMPTIRFPKRPAGGVYDVLEMKPVEVKTDGDWMSITADLRDYPGKIFAFLPAAIDKVSLQATTKVAAGKTIEFTASVVDAAGQAIDSSFPLEITITDGAGKIVQRMNRAAAPTFRAAYAVPTNIGSGTWKVRVRELISGCVSECAIAVEGGTGPQGQADARVVWVRDAEQIKKFVADKTPASIVVDQDQAWVQTQATRLAEALTKAGKPTKVARVDEVMTLPVDWNRDLPTLDGSRLWRGDVVQPGLLVAGPVILMGRRFESRLIEGVTRRDALVETASSNFPGAGKSILAWVPLAFNNKSDTVLVMAQDEAGLAKGVDAMLASNPGAEIAIRQIAKPAVDTKASLAAAAPGAKQPGSYRRFAGLVDPVVSLDVDAATGRTLVGTFGYGHNAFCFDAQGKLLWKQFLPEHNVYLMKWYDGGKRIIAATGRGPWIFMLNPADGKVVRKFVASEWPDGHGYGGFWEGQTDTQLNISINASLNQIVIVGRTGVLAVDFDGKKMWFRDRAESITAYPPTAEQTIAAAFGESLSISGIAFSGDGTKVASGEYAITGSTPGKAPGEILTLWAFRPMILDAKTGAVLAANESDGGSVTSPGGWGLAWPADSANPLVLRNGLAAPLLPDGKLGAYTAQPPGAALPDGGRIRYDDTFSLRDAKGKSVWKHIDDHIFVDDLNRISSDGTRIYRCDVDGLVRCIETASGKTLWETKVPFNGKMVPLADGSVVIGTIGGTIAKLDAKGQIVWNAALIDLFERPTSDYAGYIASANRRDVDNTGELYPINHDGPGDYDKIFRMGVEQLKNGSFETADGWTSADGAIKSEAPAKDGGKALVLPTSQLVTQRLTQRIIPQGTYLLEFWYMTPDESTRIVAGAMLTGDKDKQTLTASRFLGRPGEWTFGRLAVKSLVDTKTIDIGFQSENGVARIDAASFRAVRFPSANLLANTELHAVEPTFVKDLRVQYDRIPSAVRDRLMSKNHVAVYRQGPSNTAIIYAQEQAFLHNGRLDDLGPFWTNPPDPMGFSSVLTRPSWVSHIVLYLNNATPDNTYRFFSVLANNMETKVPQQVALVRGNDRRFVVVKFDKPVFTDSIKILPGFHGGHLECLTEVELYGPLGGPDASAAGFPIDEESYPMYMGSPSHVPTKLPADLSGTFTAAINWNLTAAYACGMTASDQLVTYGGAGGNIGSARVPAPGATTAIASGPGWGLAGVAPLGTPAHYGSRMLVGSADFQMHAVSDRGVYLWGFKTGGRVYSSPVPNGDDVYFGSDDGRLYKVDLHSGMLLWEFVTGDRIRSSPALVGNKVYVASYDGFLYAVDTESGQLAWKSPIGKFTRCSPAVANGKVYIGDEAGQMYCFDAATGAQAWKVALGGYISTCPLVTPEGIVFGSDQGNLALLDLAGGVKWKKEIKAGIRGALYATTSQIIVPTASTAMVLSRATGEVDAEVEGIGGGLTLAAVVYQGRLFVVRASIATNFNSPPRTYALFYSSFEVWAPGPAGSAKPKATNPPKAK